MNPVRRHELTDAQWAQLAPLLPPQRPRIGRPAKDHRTVLNGILWILRTGAPWRDLPERYGAWQTVYSRFRRWQHRGVWAHDRPADRRGARWHAGRFPGHDRRHHCACPSPRGRGPEKGGADPNLGRSRGGWGSKLHLITDRCGKPIVCALTAGQRHESPQAIPLLERALHRMWPEALAGDKGYSATDLRQWLAEREILAVIPRRTDETGPDDYDRTLIASGP